MSRMLQLQAEKLAEESLKKWGFVVVGYHYGEEPKRGSRTGFLWKEFKMPQPFSAIRRAEPDEWNKQIELLKELTGLTPLERSSECVPWILVTD